MQADRAETIALQVLTWLVSNDELLPVFLGASGTSEGDLAPRVGEPEFLVAVLDFLVMDDAWVLSAAEHLNMPPETFIQARYALPGGEEVSWT